jgi:putative spermidine/putrescine transport system permease protein
VSVRASTRIGRERAGLGLRLAAAGVVVFLYFPVAIIVLNAFNVESSYFTFPPPAFTTDWFGITFRDPALWAALRLSLTVATVVTALALVIGTSLAAAVYRTTFFGREAVSFLVVLPIALPGIVTGIALRSTFVLADIPFGVVTLIVAHATFCIVIVYNNAVARFRRMSPNLIEASADLGASGWQTVRHIVLPQLATALLAGAVLAFALSFDEIIVTTFTAGQQQTIPIYILNRLFRPRQRPVTNVVAILVILVTFVPILVAQILSRRTDAERPAGAP